MPALIKLPVAPFSARSFRSENKPGATFLEAFLLVLLARDYPVNLLNLNIAHKLGNGALICTLMPYFISCQRHLAAL
jgi:hypothetical protein